MSQQQFENFTASSLYCEKCKAAMPVRERLLLVLPDREIYDYLCTGCASSVGRRADAASFAALERASSYRSRYPAGQAGGTHSANRAAADQEGACGNEDVDPATGADQRSTSNRRNSCAATGGDFGDGLWANSAA